MDKLKMETSDMAAENIEKIGALFPSAVTEMRGEDGSIKKGVNFEMLKQLLSPDVVEEGDERYEFTWVGKKQAIAEAARPTTKTLRPVKEDSRNWDATENLYIEGDNLEVLKILQESYLGKVKMIYIDPPYNTGHDFIYRDDFGMSREEWSEKSGELSEDGDRLFENTESNGRFHSDWCSMTYSRLMLARNLLTEDGVVFISLDDGEIENLREICNEVFGEQNFLAQCVRKRRDSQANLSKNISPIHEYVVLYAKSNGNLLNKISAHINERDYKNPDNDPRGPYKTIGFRVFRVDESNMKNVYYHPEEVTQLMLGETVSNIKEDRTDLDLLYACLLDWGVEINLSHTSTQVAGCTVHNVDNGALAACFDKAVPRAVVEYIANLQPLRAVFRDSAFATDAEKINVTEIFKNLSPDTKVKVI